jgi:hypothetical protein
MLLKILQKLLIFLWITSCSTYVYGSFFYICTQLPRCQPTDMVPLYFVDVSLLMQIVKYTHRSLLPWYDSPLPFVDYCTVYSTSMTTLHITLITGRCQQTVLSPLPF